MFTFNPINIEGPPAHTKIQTRCDTCAKRKVCGIITDYYKTATLIENILGNPQKDRELICDYGFTGLDFEEKIFPEKISIEPLKEGEPALEGNYLNAKYKNKDKVKLLYEVNKYFVMFVLTWSEEFERYELTYNKEIYFGITFNLSEETLNLLRAPLVDWREEQIKKEEEEKKKEIINTTLFSCDLRCSEYEFDKRQKNYDMTENYHHIATYHKEDAPVPLYKKDQGAHPIAYPVFVPKEDSFKPVPPHRRGDICDC